jgi:hypothetical protein
MDCNVLKEQLNEAERQVIEAIGCFQRQRALVDRLNRNGRDAADAMAVLKQFETIQTRSIAHRDRLLQATATVHVRRVA